MIRLVKICFGIAFLTASAALAPVIGQSELFVSEDELEAGLGLSKSEVRKAAESLEFRFVRTLSWFWKCVPFGGGEPQDFLTFAEQTQFFTTVIVRRGVMGLISGFELVPGELLISDPEIFPGSCPDGMEMHGEMLTFEVFRMDASTDGQTWVTIGRSPGD